MRGDEVGLGTPHEDIASIVAVNELKLERKFLLSIAFGVDAFHGVNHFQFLEAVSDLASKGHYLGLLSLLNDMEEVHLFKEAYRYVESKMPVRPSIVTSSIVSAVEGNYGDYHANPRTQGSKLWINPLMPVYWGFDLKGVAQRCLYYDQVKEVSSFYELELAIEKFRSNHKPIRGWDEIPV
ncbi:MAG: DUF1152 domain-containing protein [Verrucomicrobiota bacterium]